MGASSKFVIAVLTALIASAPSFAHAQANALPGATAEKGYWTKNHRTLKESDKRSITARKVFAKVLSAADRKPGPAPELVILDEQGYPWARSLPDGSILLTRGAIDICMNSKSKEETEAKLAFIIGHELSHQVNGDFWHFFFYSGANPGPAMDEEDRKALEGAVKIAKQSDSVMAKELKADQYGVIYASQAGYHVRRIVDEDENFFREWTAATNPGLLEGRILSVTHPEIEERSAAVIVALKRVAEKLDVFDKGVASYKNSSYVAARKYFEDFLSVYQSREAFNNLGLVYYQMAEDEYAKWRLDEEPNFQLSLVVDPTNRARKTLAEGEDDDNALVSAAFAEESRDQTLFNRHADKAMRYFREAVNRDPGYAPAHNNLACVHFLKGEYSSAVGELDAGLKLNPNMPEAYNNRAVSYMSLGKELQVDLARKAEADLNKALELRKDYADALYNLAYLYKITGREKERAETLKELGEQTSGDEEGKKGK
ncbi:MAG: M48 family metalloprotease [Nitrospinae bacterium]|nr:M48 family metalloprotease [Nitrospinota bacterium]